MLQAFLHGSIHDAQVHLPNPSCRSHHGGLELELPHKLVLGGNLFPDMEEDRAERREERLWKCLTRSGVLDSTARRRLRGGERQSLEKISQRENVCWNKMTGTRPWLKEMGIGIQAEPITVNRT